MTRAAVRPPATARGQDRRRLPLPVVLSGLSVALVVVASVAVSVGSVWLPLDQVWKIIVDHVFPGVVQRDWTPVRAAIVWDSRLPRVVMAAVVGAALALSGAVAQAVTRNPLADPYLLGVSSGGGLALVVVTVLGIGSGLLGYVTTPVAAFLGGLAALLVVLTIGSRSGSVTTLLLAGIAVAQICSALTSLIIFLHSRGEAAKQILHWLAGGMGDARWDVLAVPSVVLLVTGALALGAARWLNLLHAGDDTAAALGISPARVRWYGLVGVSLVAGASVAVAGGIGFVGLLVPHAAAFLVGSDLRRLLPTAALLGAVFLVLADLLGRIWSSAGELPAGVVTALVGGPAFAILLARQGRKWT
ncbi:ABC transporter permease [Longimycelium tulufanense]|uniref:ABC transporter permease n=1 Tax=Longimycelium tulufanense TaxID=907463 RepID=A0A8J3CK50_9PSEU|nr:iron ABC transporter permease [Longimycelium tulufanense]GGM74784.1 ABC transporter permease [Longimycelium tulufanense]